MYFRKCVILNPSTAKVVKAAGPVYYSVNIFNILISSETTAAGAHTEEVSIWLLGFSRS